jgi:chromosome segregation ATPase
MTSGFSYLLVQLGLLLLVVLVAGGLAGRYVFPSVRAVVRRRGTVAFGPDIDDLRLDLAAAKATVTELRTTVATITDHKDAEMGWLESRAIQAMDSLVLSHEERVQALQEQVKTSAAEVRHLERELEAERRHTLRLQAALVERDERVATLTESLSQRDRQLNVAKDVANLTARGSGA